MHGYSDGADAATPDPSRPLDVAALRAALGGCHLGHPLVYLPEVGSTNTHAVALARQGAADGTLVITDHQTAGRGRAGRPWQSLPGRQLALSLILHPCFPPHFLVMASALAVAGAIEAKAIEAEAIEAEAIEAEVIAVATALRPDIKWPNDVLLDGRKVCGILIETSGDFAVLGIGLNVNGAIPADSALAARAVTLAQALGRAVSREALATELLRRLDDAYARLQSGGEDARADAQCDVRAAWRARLGMLGRPVVVQQGAHQLVGLAEDVDDDGALILRGADGARHLVTWGDVG